MNRCSTCAQWDPFHVVLREARGDNLRPEAEGLCRAAEYEHLDRGSLMSAGDFGIGLFSPSRLLTAAHFGCVMHERQTPC